MGIGSVWLSFPLGYVLSILLVDYGDEITVNMKDEGKRDVMKDIEKEFSNDLIRVSEVLGFNNIEYTIKKS